MRLRSLVPQRFDGIDARGFHRRVESKDYAYRYRHTERDQHR